MLTLKYNTNTKYYLMHCLVPVIKNGSFCIEYSFHVLHAFLFQKSGMFFVSNTPALCSIAKVRQKITLAEIPG
jgi:hypothetical protein